jgi:Flp pilus assembly protein TadD
VSYRIGTLLSPMDAGISDFKECLKHFRAGHTERALLCARRALNIAPKNPFYLSCAGLLASKVEQRVDLAEMLCQEAIGMRHNDAQLYLNLAEVYRNAQRSEEAIQVLERGLKSTGRDFRIRRALEKIATRRKPVFSGLRRGHPLNRILGKFRHRLLRRLLKTA